MRFYLVALTCDDERNGYSNEYCILTVAGGGSQIGVYIDDLL